MILHSNVHQKPPADSGSTRDDRRTHDEGAPNDPTAQVHRRSQRRARRGRRGDRPLPRQNAISRTPRRCQAAPPTAPQRTAHPARAASPSRQPRIGSCFALLLEQEVVDKSWERLLLARPVGCPRDDISWVSLCSSGCACSRTPGLAGRDRGPIGGEDARARPARAGRDPASAGTADARSQPRVHLSGGTHPVL